MDDVTLIKYLSGSDPRGLPNNPNSKTYRDNPTSRDNGNQPASPNYPGGTDNPANLSPGQRKKDNPGGKQYYDINNDPNKGDDMTNGPEQTQLPNDDGDSAEIERKRPLG